MKLFKTLPVMSLSLLLLAACNKAPVPAATATATAPTASTEKPVATVNGQAISRDTFEYYVKSTAGKAASELSPEQRAQLLDNLIRGVAVAQQAEKEGLQNNGDTAALLMLQRVQTLEQAAAEHYLKDRKSSDTELKAEYDAQVASMPRTQYRARHILVASQADAQKIIDEIKKGAKFEDLAKKDSTDSSKNQGGELGWFSPQTMVKPFADAVTNLKKGEMTPTPVQTQFGWHVIQLEDSRETPVPPFDQVKERVDQIVQSKKFKAYSDDLLKNAKVERNLS